MNKFQCVNKDCVASGQVFEWDNVDGAVCRSCEQPMASDKAPKASKVKVAEDE